MVETIANITARLLFIFTKKYLVKLEITDEALL